MKTITALLCAACACAAVLNAAGEPKAGSLDKDGDLIVHVFHSVDSPPVPLPVKLEVDYAFMIFNIGSFEAPEMEVKIAFRKDKKIITTKSWKEIGKILAAIPEGSEIRYYGKCLCPTYYGLPADTWDRFAALLE